MYIVVWSLFNS